MDDENTVSLIVSSNTTREIGESSDLPDLEHMFAGQLAVSSIAMYKRDVETYFDYAKVQGDSWLDPQTLISWRAHLVLGSAKSPNTINRMIAAVKRIVREMASRDIVSETTALKFHQVRGVTTKSLKKRLKQHSRTKITPEDMRRLCESPDTSTPIGKRDAALLATLASSGIRASEAATLTLQQIEKRGKGYVVHVMGKTDTEYRDAHLSPEAFRLINDWIQKREALSQFIFTGFTTRAAKPVSDRISEVTVWTIVKRYAKQCDLEHIKPHDFRRFVGTQLAAKDIRKAQKALGHRSIEVTARHYVLDELEVGLTDHLY